MPPHNCFWNFIHGIASFICCFSFWFHLSTTLCSLFLPVNHFFQSSYLLTLLQLFAVLIVLVLICCLWILCRFSSPLTAGHFFVLFVTGFCFSDYPLNFQDVTFNSFTFHSKSSIQVISTNP